MLVLIQTIIIYILLLLCALFLIWLAAPAALYQNNQCSLTQLQTFNYTNNFSSTIDPRLRLNHFTILGTHNSYHKYDIVGQYSHEDLDKQLTFGIRQLELDLHLKDVNQLVYHIQLFDDQTNCYCLNECLMKIVQWKSKYLSHFPIYLFFEIKQMFYEDLLLNLHGGVKCQNFEELKAEVLQLFSSDTFILPPQIQGNQSSLKVALKQQRQNELSGDYSYHNYGWTPLYQSLGKILPVFIDDVENIVPNLYSQCEPLRDFFFIAQANVDLDYASIISLSDPANSQQIMLNSAINGQIIRILLGYGGKNLDTVYQTSKQYGIHIISSDSVECTNTPLCQLIANDFQNSSILCNSYSAPTFCNSSIPNL